MSRPLQELKPLNMSPIILQSLYIEKSAKEKRFFCKIYEKNTYNAHMNFVGKFDFIAITGQFISICLEGAYRNRDLEAQILIYMMHDMQKERASHIWQIQKKKMASCDGSSVFYSTLWFFRHVLYNVHKTVVEGGYAMEIPVDIKALVLPT